MTAATPQLWRTVLWSLVGLLVLIVATRLQCRLPAGETAAWTFDANFPRWLLGFSGGALLALAGARFDKHITSPFTFLAVSTGAIAGCVAGFLNLGEIGAAGGLVLGAVVGGALACLVPPHNTFAILAGLALAGLGIYLASQVKVEPNLGRTLTWLAAGDTSHATVWFATTALLITTAIVVFRSLDRWPALGLGLGAGLIGPVAFVSWWVPLAEARLTRLNGLQRDLMLAFAGGVIVVTVDAVQRWLIGGYGLVSTSRLPWWVHRCGCGGTDLVWWAGKVTSRASPRS